MSKFHLSDDELAGLLKDLELEDLQMLTCVVMAQCDLEVGNHDVALHRLSSEADKFICYQSTDKQVHFIESAINRYRQYRDEQARVGGIQS